MSVGCGVKPDTEFIAQIRYSPIRGTTKGSTSTSWRTAPAASFRTASGVVADLQLSSAASVALPLALTLARALPFEEKNKSGSKQGLAGFWLAMERMMS